MTRRIRLPLLLLLALTWNLPSAAQITITQSDVRDQFDQGFAAQQLFEADDGQESALQMFLESTQGGDQVYDFTAFDFSPDADSILIVFDYLSLPASTPGEDEPGFDPADYALTFSFEDEASSIGFFNYLGVESDGFYDYGFLTESEIVTDPSQTGGTSRIESEVIEVNRPAGSFPAGQRILALPLTNGTAWRDSTLEETRSEQVLFDASDTPQQMLRDTTYAAVGLDAAVEGYGQLILPDGSDVVPVLRLRTTTTRIDSSLSFQPGDPAPTLRPDTTVSTTVLFVTKDLRLRLSISLDEQGAVESADYTIESNTGQEAALNPGGTISFGGISVSAGGGSGSATRLAGTPVRQQQADGTIRGFRFDRPPASSTFDGEAAVARDGSMVTPDAVSQDEYYLLIAQEVDGPFRVCLEYSGLSGVSDPGALVVLRRENASQPWAGLDSEPGDDGEVCAAGLASLSQFAVGSNGDLNPLPVELTAFDARFDGAAAVLTWQTASETGNAGFEIQRAVDGGAFQPVGFQEGAGTTAAPRSYRFTDTSVPYTARRLAYRLRQIDLDGTATLSQEVALTVGRPQAFALEGSFPNPFRAATTIRYALPEAMTVRLSVYDALGREVAVLADEHQAAGRKEVRFEADRLPSGVYFYRLEAGGFVQARRMVLTR